MAMQLRSGRRLASPVPVPAPGGDLRRVRPRHNQDGVDYDEKDLISDLPKDMRLEVLARLPCTREAMRTSVLSGPWRRLWTELRDLTFDDAADLDSLLRALGQVRPKLNRLCIQIASDNLQLGAASISSLLDSVDRLEPLHLVVMLCTEHRGAPFVLPCFARATSMELCMPRLYFTLPLTGSFASLEELTLFGGSIVDPGVFLPRCPRLRSLRMNGSCPLGVNNKALAVESSSLHELGWHLLDIEQPVDLHVVAPNLRNFVFKSFSRKFTVSLSAPKLEELYFEYSLEDSAVGCTDNERWRLYELKLESPNNGDGLQHQLVLSLYIDNVLVIPPVERSIEQEVARLPVTLTHFSTLELHLRTDGHVFGALVLQLLQIRTTIQRLKVILVGVDTECWENCDCDLASNWRNEPISLPCLEVAHFRGFRGCDHEIDFLKLLVGAAPSLNKIIVKHSNKISTVRGACKKLRNIFSTNASVKFSFS